MGYNDEEYLRYSMMLRSAVYGLLENEIDLDEIVDMVEEAGEDV